MRILLLTHSFNSLSQRLYVELAHDGHEVSVELDIHDRVTAEASELFHPKVILAPFLKRAIPGSVWQQHLCLILHPGPPGDRGPCALDWAILRGASTWGVTVLQAQAELDAGPVWGSASFPMRAVRKSSLYRNEVTEAAVIAVRAALARVSAGAGPEPRTASRQGWQPALRQAQRAIDWQRDDCTTVLRKIHSVTAFPASKTLYSINASGCLMLIGSVPRLGAPGAVIARRRNAICRATRDGAVWIGQLQPMDGASRSFKRPALLVLGAEAEALPRIEEDPNERPDDCSYRGEIRYEERGAVGYLHFDFYNGAFSTQQCERLRSVYAQALRRPTRAIVLMGGTDFW